MNTLKTVLLGYLLVVNIGAFAAYGVDKKIAQHNELRNDGVNMRRISEKALFLWAILGGALGALVGMKLWRHKTKHWYFVWGIPAILVLQLALAAWLVVRTR